MLKSCGVKEIIGFCPKPDTAKGNTFGINTKRRRRWDWMAIEYEYTDVVHRVDKDILHFSY